MPYTYRKLKAFKLENCKCNKIIYNIYIKKITTTFIV